MSDDVYIIGVGMIKFGKFLERSVKDMTGEVLEAVLKDCDLTGDEIEAAWFSNTMWGLYSFQHSIRGQVALTAHGLQGIPVTNVENACASASTALQGGWTAIKAGLYDCALAIGVEKQYNEDRTKVMGSFIAGTDVEEMSKRAFEVAGLGPGDINVMEVHDATAFGEVAVMEALGFCPRGEGGVMAEKGDTALGGKIPVNPSGGLISRGHPVGASGLAQIYELVTQLRGEAGERQVKNPRIAMTENGGGTVGAGEAAMTIHILEKM